MLSKPEENECPEYYKRYISLVHDHVIEYYEKQTKEVIELIEGLSEQQLQYRYEKDKWSIKELIGHLIDSEIIIGYRALTYARNDKTDLPMYEHDEYVRESDYNNMDKNLLISLYASARNTNLLMFKTFTESEWLNKGLTGGKAFTTRSIPFILAGHTKHHLTILREKYL